MMLRTYFIPSVSQPIARRVLNLQAEPLLEAFTSRTTGHNVMMTDVGTSYDHPIHPYI